MRAARSPQARTHSRIFRLDRTRLRSIFQKAARLLRAVDRAPGGRWRIRSPSAVITPWQAGAAPRHLRFFPDCTPAGVSPIAVNSAQPRHPRAALRRAPRGKPPVNTSMRRPLPSRTSGDAGAQAQAVPARLQDHRVAPRPFSRMRHTRQHRADLTPERPVAVRSGGAHNTAAADQLPLRTQEM